MRFLDYISNNGLLPEWEAYMKKHCIVLREEIYPLNEKIKLRTFINLDTEEYFYECIEVLSMDNVCHNLYTCLYILDDNDQKVLIQNSMWGYFLYQENGTIQEYSMNPENVSKDMHEYLPMMNKGQIYRREFVNDDGSIKMTIWN